MYSGILRLSPDTVDIVLLGAVQLEIMAVVELCQNYMENLCDNAKPSGVKDHSVYEYENTAQNRQVISTVYAHEPDMETEQRNSADNHVSASQIGSSAARMDTSKSSCRNSELEVSRKYGQVTRPRIASGQRQTVVARSMSRSRKRRYTVETGLGSSASEKSVFIPSSSSRMEDNSGWKPESVSAPHRYNTRKRARLSEAKSESSSGVAVQKMPQKQFLSTSAEPLPLPVATKPPYLSVSNKIATSTPVYCLPAWRRSRKLLLAARFLLVKQVQVTDGGCLRCRQCDVKGFASRSHLRAHVLCRHREWRCCFSCGHRFKSFVALLRHRNNKHRHFPSSRFRSKRGDAESPSCREVIPSSHNKCGWCGQKFASRSTLLEHRQVVHRKRGKAPSTPPCHRVTRKWRCCEKDCGVEFKYKDMLRIHMAEQHPNVIFSCPECRFKTQVEHVLKRYCSHFVYFLIG